MKRLALILLFVTTLQGFSEFSTEAPQARFDAAHQAYDSGRYSDAIALYDGLIADHWQAAEVYFNRGNALAKIGKMGEAIASYEMALLINPRDADATANLKFLRDQVGLPAPEQNLLARLSVHYTSTEWRAAAQALWWIFVALMSAYWLMSSRPYWLRQCALFAGVLLAVSLTGFTYGWWQQRSPLVVVTKSDVHALFAPLPDATPFFDTPEGSTLRLVERTGDWLRVRAGKQIGWIPAESCSTVGL